MVPEHSVTLTYTGNHWQNQVLFTTVNGSRHTHTKHPYSNTHCWTVATTLLYLPGQLIQKCLAHGRNPTAIKLVSGSIHLNSGLPGDLGTKSDKLNLVEVLFNMVKMYLPSLFKTISKYIRCNCICTEQKCRHITGKTKVHY